MSQAPERLTIEGFAGIAHLDLEVRPFTVLIGPQSVGKSIAAKLLSFFKSAARNLVLASFRDVPLSAEKAMLKRFTETIQAPGSSGGSTKITYSDGRLRFTLELAGEEGASWKMTIPLALRRAYQELVTELDRDGDEDENEDAAELARAAFEDHVSEIWPGAFVPSRFVPAGRSFFSQIESDPAAYIETASVDAYVLEFWKFLVRLKKRRLTVSNGGVAASLVKKLLGGEYTREGKEEFIYTFDGRQLRPGMWSSGQQEAQPLALLLQRYCEGYLSPPSLFIEEPEAHLFPSSQRVITELIALAFNARHPKIEIFVTTHSPYILTTINNLLVAGRIYQQELPFRRRTALARIVPHDRALTPGQVGAFYMDRSGCRSIIDPETGLIDASAIDQVSNELNDQFDALLNFDPA